MWASSSAWMLCPRVIKLPVFIRRSVHYTHKNKWMPVDVVLYPIFVILSSLHLSIVLEVWNWNSREELCRSCVSEWLSLRLPCLTWTLFTQHYSWERTGQVSGLTLNPILSLSGCTAMERHVLAEEEMRMSCKVWWVGKVLELPLPGAENYHELAGLLFNKSMTSAVLREANEHLKSLLLASVFSSGAKHPPGGKKT